uniref:Uncharacterized protein n=1 Tax=Salix viminalis TaxID=40686 RepID=A0A6N2KWG7_SALVM
MIPRNHLSLWRHQQKPRCISSPTGTETNPHSCRDREGEALPATFPRDRTCVLTLSGVKATVHAKDINVYPEV